MRYRRKSIPTVLCTLALLLCLVAQARAEGDVYSYRIPGSSDDHRFAYEIALMELALEKTLPEYGPYELQPAFAMNLPRAKAVAKLGAVENLVIKTSYSQAMSEEFLYSTFPIDRGIFSYRICFANNTHRKTLSKANSLTDLQALSIGQGVGWLDADILRHNGFTVKESPKYESLFPMLAAGRIDLVCRAQNEISSEWQAFGALGSFYMDKTFALYYPLPRFFWMHKSKRKAFDRLHHGLKAAYRDGSALTLWQKHYRDKLSGISLKNRRIYRLENPFLEGINEQYRDYFLNDEVAEITTPETMTPNPDQD